MSEALALLAGGALATVIGAAIVFAALTTTGHSDTQFLRGFRYGDVLMLASGGASALRVMVLAVEIDRPQSTLPIERVTVLCLDSTGKILPSLMASVWVKVDDA